MKQSETDLGDRQLDTVCWSIGREPSCDLALDQANVSGHHASLEMADDGLVSLTDCGSSNGTFLNRNDCWIRIKRITLCIGDRVRFGDYEVALHRLTAVMGDGSNARLGDRHFKIPEAKNAVRAFPEMPNSRATLKKPVRNPLTGKIEERDS